MLEREEGEGKSQASSQLFFFKINSTVYSYFVMAVQVACSKVSGKPLRSTVGVLKELHVADSQEHVTGAPCRVLQSKLFLHSAEKSAILM